MSTPPAAKKKIYALLLNILFILSLGAGLYYYTFTTDNSEPSLEQSQTTQTAKEQKAITNSGGSAGFVSATNATNLLHANSTIPPTPAKNATGIPSMSNNGIDGTDGTDDTEGTDGISNITNTLNEENFITPLKYSTGQTKSGGEVTGKIIAETPAYTGTSNTDSWIRPLFIESLAHTLVSNYWPKDSHPSAQQKGIIALSLRHTNSIYANKQTGLWKGEPPSTQTRQQILHYAFTSSMLQHIYSLYADALIQTMGHLASQNRSGSGYTAPLTQAQTAEMFSLYSHKLRGLSGACMAFINNGQIPQLLDDYANAQHATTQANLAYIASTKNNENSERASFIPRDDYLKSIALREQSKINVASAMRLHGNTTSLDTDELIYIAAWLTRRKPDATATIETLASLFADSATLFATAATRLPHISTTDTAYATPMEDLQKTVNPTLAIPSKPSTLTIESDPTKSQENMDNIPAPKESQKEVDAPALKKTQQLTPSTTSESAQSDEVILENTHDQPLASTIELESVSATSNGTNSNFTPLPVSTENFNSEPTITPEPMKEEKTEETEEAVKKGETREVGETGEAGETATTPNSNLGTETAPTEPTKEAVQSSKSSTSTQKPAPIKPTSHQSAKTSTPLPPPVTPPIAPPSIPSKFNNNP